MKIISWNLLRLIGASADEVADLVAREQPDVLLMQEATQAIDRLPDLVGGHYMRKLQPGRVHGLAVWTRRKPVEPPKVVPLPQGAMFRRIGIVVDMGDFAAMNEVYAAQFQPPHPARTTVAVAGLPLGARIEIELVADDPTVRL